VAALTMTIHHQEICAENDAPKWLGAAD